MKLSHDEELFLRHWIYDEAHYLTGVGPAKRLQVEYRVSPADLALLITAAMPEPAQQADAAAVRHPAAPAWPWTEITFPSRLADARRGLDARR